MVRTSNMVLPIGFGALSGITTIISIDLAPIPGWLSIVLTGVITALGFLFGLLCDYLLALWTAKDDKRHKH